ncbi:hypothetical protein [Aquimarina latercula]|uniref:hypothetical protein n=1 Tax=Aquimarina latercula TaxID=987 RepID=UPI000401AE31|nr:hypothetical protein [Aquimarina latercula]
MNQFKMNKILGNTSEKDTITTVLKIVSAVYLVMNTIRLGMELQEKIKKRQHIKRRKNTEL